MHKFLERFDDLLDKDMPLAIPLLHSVFVRFR
jgi:hypothetical protein